MDEYTIYFTNERKYLDFYMVKQNATIDLIKSKGGLEDDLGNAQKRKCHNS